MDNFKLRRSTSLPYKTFQSICCGPRLSSDVAANVQVFLFTNLLLSLNQGYTNPIARTNFYLVELYLTLILLIK